MMRPSSSMVYSNRSTPSGINSRGKIIRFLSPTVNVLERICDLRHLLYHEIPEAVKWSSGNFPLLPISLKKAEKIKGKIEKRLRFTETRKEQKQKPLDS